jgi:hypothetical protein
MSMNAMLSLGGFFVGREPSTATTDMTAGCTVVGTKIVASVLSLSSVVIAIGMTEEMAP